MRRSWGAQSAIAFDQFVNAFLFGGWADETFSARCYRQGRRAFERGERDRWLIAWRAVDMLFFWQDGHCAQAFDAERARAHFPLEYRS